MRPAHGGLPDIEWFTADGREMGDKDWVAGKSQVLAVFLNGRGIRELDQRGEPIVDDSFYICFSADAEPARVRLPGADHASAWTFVLDTADPARYDWGGSAPIMLDGASIQIEPTQS